MQLQGHAPALGLLYFQHALRQGAQLGRTVAQPGFRLVFVQRHLDDGVQFTLGKRLENVAVGFGEFGAGNGGIG